MNIPTLPPNKFYISITVLLLLMGCQNNSGISELEDIPSVTLTAPAHSQTDVPTNTSISVQFSEDMNPTTITDSSFTLRMDTIMINGFINYADSTAIFTPFSDLNFESTYTVTITTDAQNLSGNGLYENYEWNFSTQSQQSETDDLPPQISSTNPPSNATGISVNTAIVVSFSEPINASTINTATFFLTNSNTPISANVSYANTTAILTPMNSLDFDDTYTATLSTSVQDTAGNALAENFSWNFTTGNQPDNNAPQVTSTAPTNNQNNVPVTSNITVTFNEQINTSTITNESFFLELGNNDIEGEFSFSANGTSVTLAPDDDLEFEENYTVTLTTDIEDLAGNNLASGVEWKFTTGDAPDTEAPQIEDVEPGNNENNVPINTSLTITFTEAINESSVNLSTILLQEGNSFVPRDFEVNGNVVTIFPSSNLQYETEYTTTVTTGVEDLSDNNLSSNVEWEFTTIDAPDSEAPEIVSIEPDDNEDDVPINTNITITFTEAINESSVNSSTFRIEEDGNRILGFRNVSDNVLTFNPVFNLQYETEYTIILTTGIQDESGNGLESNVESEFETEEEPDDDDPEIFATDPEPNTTNIPIDTEISVTFSEPMNSATVNENSFILFQNGSTVAGDVPPFTGSTALFIPNQDLEPNTTYAAQITTEAEDIAGNNLANTYNWSFTTEQESEPPIVESTSPNEDEADVSVGIGEVTVTFNEAMNADTFDENSFSVAQGPAPISGSVPTFTGNEASFILDEDLQPGTTYTVTISTAVEDLAGNNLVVPYEWSFTTEQETDPPTLLTTDPASGETEVELNVIITAIFNEELDESTVNTTNVTLVLNDTIQVMGAVNYSSNPSEISFTPTLLIPGSNYTVSISSIQDLAGNTASDEEWSFMTIPGPLRISARD